MIIFISAAKESRDFYLFEHKSQDDLIIEEGAPP